MFDPSTMIKQFQKAQQNIAKIQDSLKERYIDATAGGGMVTAVVNGHQELVQIKIDPQVVDPEDVTMLEDMILAAVNQAVEKSKEMAEKEMEKATGGLNLGGMGDILKMFGG